ncbi:aconitate hydratase AcnA [Iamia sp. SCSIO 61187]|uniref:aconitate hydratase AcnA n=1 Tax=Iamia sp. SCSIO 61187 TaxID=2722752 RepID=UPI00272C9842|nr:aconitate hydratase AcnA [Iamia sp. SCSIO 61187]QYG92450.1 aconitate hydratase AcnA [Iamia sp. SCSIO 61187]
MASDSFGARRTLDVGGRSVDIYALDAATDDVGRLPYGLKVLLENLLRTEDGVKVSADDVSGLAAWQPGQTSDAEISFTPSRVLMQDFTGVPAVVDLAAMRDAMADLGGDPATIEPLVPVDLVIDHSIQVDHFAQRDSFDLNATLELQRNKERYEFLKWGQQAFESLRVVPPNMGICHQINLENLSQVVQLRDGVAFPDTLVGTDSHTPMVNGLGVVGWGVGGIEAEAAMLGQPVPLLVPKVTGLRLTGELPPGTTATDLVLTITELLRQHGVVGKFVELHGPALSQLRVEHRATIGNMSPEYGSTITISPVDDETLRYLRATGRPDDLVALVEAYAKEQGLWHDPSNDPQYDSVVELDMSTVVPSLAGPKRPQDRIPLDRAKDALSAVLNDPTATTYSAEDRAIAATFPASDPVSSPADDEAAKPHVVACDTTPAKSNKVDLTLADGTETSLDHGRVVIAAITSCTNTSNPDVMVAAGLLARNARAKGLTRRPWVKTSLAPGSKVVMDYYDRLDLTDELAAIGFDLVGYGCTTCIGNSGPLPAEISQAVQDNDLTVAAVLSGNRNFEGRINPDVRLNYLASPPLVVAYALSGTMSWDPLNEPLGTDTEGQPVMLADIWPDAGEVAEAVARATGADSFTTIYDTLFDGDDRWRAIDAPTGDRMDWDGESTYVRQPPYFEGLSPTPSPRRDIEGARVLALLGDSVTTDHISPAGNIKAESPAGRYLHDHGVEKADFNSYGSRRGNHEVMIRGTFANIRLRNQLLPGSEGGVTKHVPTGEAMDIYDASERYLADGTPLVVLAGAEYGSGSSRDWAAKGTALLGVRAVIAQSYERIHRSNLIGMGVLPLQLAEGDSVESLGLTGEEEITITGLSTLGDDEPVPPTLEVRAGDVTFTATVRIDTPTEQAYYRHGGVLPYVLRSIHQRTQDS